MGKKIRKDETKAANAAKVVTEQDYNALLEKYQEATKRIDLMSKDSDELVKEIASLKSSIGSYKSANTKTRNELEKMKAYAKEADELNEQKAARISTLDEALEGMTKQRDASIKDVEFANDKNNELSKELTKTRDALTTAREQIAMVSTNNKDLADEVCVLTSNIEWYNNLPWYVRMFKKIPMASK